MKKTAPFGYYFCPSDGQLYIKELDYIEQTECFDECWLKSTENGQMLPFSISFDKRYFDGHLEFLGPL